MLIGEDLSLKKMKILVLLFSGLLLCACAKQGNADNPNQSDTQSETQPGQDSQTDAVMTDVDADHVITAEQVADYPLLSQGRWPNLALDVSYQIPDIQAPAQKPTQIYPHGHSFYYYDNYTMYVEGLLDNEDYTLETLFEQIAEQKQNDKYKQFYGYAGYFKCGKPEKTEMFHINGRDALYFEYQLPPAEGDEASLITIFGYSFEFEGKPLCVYSMYMEEHQNFFTRTEMTFDEVKQCAIYLISSMERYNGETFEELDQQGNFYNSFRSVRSADDLRGSFNEEHHRYPISSDKRNVFFMTFGKGAGYGIVNGAGDGFDDFRYPYIAYAEEGERLNREYLMKDGITVEEILPLTLEQNDFLLGNPQIIDQSMVEIAGIEMQRTLLQQNYNDGIVREDVVVYTFVLDETPYIWKIELDFASEILGEMSEQTYEQYRKTTELVADTLIRTIRVAPNDVDIMQEMFDQLYEGVNN